MSLIHDIEKDLRTGTPGPWRIVDCDSLGDRCTHYFQEVWNDETDVLVTTEVTRAHNDGGKVNVRRIARVPQLEAALLAAEELAEACLRVDRYLTKLQAPGSEPLNSVNGSTNKKDRGYFTAQVRNETRVQWADLGNAIAAYRKAVGEDEG